MTASAGAGRRGAVLPWRWALWRLPPAEAAYVLGWIVAAVVATCWSLVRQDVEPRDWVDLVGLAVLAVGYDEISRRVENARLGVTETGHHVSMRSVWAFVGAATLPLSLFALLTATIYLHASVSGRRPMGFPTVFNGSTMISSAVAAAAILVVRPDAGSDGAARIGAVLTVAAAVTAYFLVNTAALAGWFVVRRGGFEWADLGTRSENLLEVGTLGIGAACALSGNVWAVVLAVPVLYLLQRSALVDELEVVAKQDAKTGLLNATAWQAAAERELRRSEQTNQPLAVLVVDLDHFKAVNDRHGHLVGDVVLTQVAACLTATLRDRDLVGRFGGEEFVAVLPMSRPHEAAMVAERVRAAVASSVATVESDGTVRTVRVTASIGVAGAPHHGRTLADLLAVADRAMYVAKEAGRDRVATGPDDGGPSSWHEPARPAA